MAAKPKVIAIAGPNGAGKSTTAPFLLKATLGVMDFVNADVIAQGLSGFAPEGAAIAAGRIMLTRLRQLAGWNATFAFETTLATRSYAPWLSGLIRRGYEFHLVFLWLPTPDAAVARVAERVRLGGHDMPEETIRRRYNRGLHNFFALYRPLAATWRVFDNSSVRGPVLIARGKADGTTRIVRRSTWTRIIQVYSDEHQER